MSDRQIQAELALLRSPALIRDVLDSFAAEAAEIKPDAKWTEALRKPMTLLTRFYRKARGAPSADPIDRKVAALANRIEIQSVGRSNVVDVGFADSDPKDAAEFVNRLLRLHVKRISSLGERADAGQLGILGGLVERSAARLSEAKHELDVYLALQGPSVLEKDEGQLRGVLAKLETDRVAAETQLLELQARVDFLSTQLTIYPETVDSESRIAETESEKYLKSRILEMEMERTELLSKYTENSTLVRQIDRQIEVAQDRLSQMVDEPIAETITSPSEVHQALDVDRIQTLAQLNAARARVQALEIQISGYRGKLTKLNEASGELERLKNEVESAREGHQAYLRQAEGARSDISMVASGNVNITFVDRAEPPKSPESSGAKKKLLAGTLAGLILGLALGLLKDWMDPSVKSSLQVSRVSEAPVIAEIPS